MRGIYGAGVVLVLAACGGSGSSTGTPAVHGTISVFAAASLTDVFKSERQAFRAAHPSADAQFNFAGSPTLVTQIQNGAPADVFASADQANMDHILQAGLNEAAPRVFATNKLQIAVAPGNPKKIAGLADLARPGLIVVLAAPNVPAGAYAEQALTKAGVKVTPKSQETDVKSVLSKVSLGEADAGIVYVTDIRAAGTGVQGVTIPDDHNVVATYPVVVLRASTNRTAAAAFVDVLLSSKGQKVLADAGFGPGQ